MAAELTLGAEEELHLVDRETWQLTARAPQLLARLAPESYSAELQRTTVETNTAVVRTLSELRQELVSKRQGLIAVAAQEGLGVAAVGTAAMSASTDFELTASGRFGRMQEQYRLLVDEQLICGTQIHVGIADRDMAVQISQRIGRELPLLLALSASSPFWSGEDTGYSSIRTIIWQRWPSAGATGPITSAKEYDELIDDLISSGVIADAKMAYFDVRPSSHAPTLELRVCDAMPIVDDAILVAGLFRAIVRAAELSAERDEPFVQVHAPMHRAAMWRAARSGLSGDLLDDSPRPQPISAAAAIRDLVKRVRPQLEELGDWDTVVELSENTLARGNSADRQRAVYAEHGRLEEVVEYVVNETHGPAEGPALTSDALPRYRVRAGDEAFMIAGAPRPVYRRTVDVVRALSPADVSAREARRDQWAVDAGMTFGVDGQQRPFAVDLLPRIIAAHEWAALTAGLTQRARAIEAFLQDVYGDQQFLADGLMPEEYIKSSPGWRAEAGRLPRGTVRAPVMGFDLVRNELGGWRVLEDNVRVPSGAGYALAIRSLLDDVMPDLPRPDGLLDPSTSMDLLRHTFGAPEATVALLSDGAGNSAWFEHQLLASRAGFLLAEPHDVDVAEGRVIHRPTGQRIDVLYLRLDVELTDLRDHSGRAIGRDLFEVAVAGNVWLANAPGNGIADDKAMYCNVPDMIGYYLNERQLLDSVPTYRTSDPTEYLSVLERVGELVSKPIDGYGGNGVLIGPSASAAEVAARRAEISANPSGWVAQELVALSSHPTFDGGSLAPRHVDLRAFVYVTGTGADDATMADLALTRVAPAGSMVVNSSRGGGAKDTWILSDTNEGDAHVRPGR